LGEWLIGTVWGDFWRRDDRQAKLPEVPNGHALTCCFAHVSISLQVSGLTLSKHPSKNMGMETSSWEQVLVLMWHAGQVFVDHSVFIRPLKAPN